MRLTLSALSLACLCLVGCKPAQQPTAMSPPQDVQGFSETSVVEAEPVPAGFFTAAPNTAAPQTTATLKAKFVLVGKVPERPAVQGKDRDPFCAPLELLSEKMVVSADGEIQNLALYLDERRTDADIPEIPVEDKTFTLDNKNCTFVPHVLALRPGQTINVTNSDKTGHNANFNFFNNSGVNFLVPAGGSKELKLNANEPAPIPVECNVHPWMKAFVIVTDHPFVGVSNDKGELIIENLPVGEVTFKVWHENANKSIDEAEVGGKKERWSRGRMEIELKAGMNDLGTIKIDAELFEEL